MGKTKSEKRVSYATKAANTKNGDYDKDLQNLSR